MFYAVPRWKGRHTYRVFCFPSGLGTVPNGARTNKNPDSKDLLSGDKVKDSAVPPPLDTASLPRPLIDCQHSQASYASFTSSATRHLSPRPLRGPYYRGSVSAGITPSPTLSQSVSRFLPVNGLLNCLYPITAFSHCQRILTRFLNFSYHARRFNMRDAYTLVRSHAYVRASILSASSRIPPASSRCPVRSSPHAIEWQATRVSTFCPEIRPPQPRRCAFGDYS